MPHNVQLEYLINKLDKCLQMKNKERKLMLCRAGRTEDFPSVLIKGRWFKDYGFSPGDRVVISNPKPHILIMTVHKTAVEMEKERKKREIDALSKSL